MITVCDSVKDERNFTCVLALKLIRTKRLKANKSRTLLQYSITYHYDLISSDVKSRDSVLSQDSIGTPFRCLDLGLVDWCLSLGLDLGLEGCSLVNHTADLYQVLAQTRRIACMHR